MKMNFKIENNFLDMTNYPYVAKHFEEMASKGWLIKKIIAGNIFIYKKIKPESLDFSITPYEVETEFTRKSKSELEEFKTVCESVGWNFVTKSLDLHIYFKEKDTDALEIQTDVEDEFRTLEKIGKKTIRGLYILIPMFIYISWSIVGDLLISVRGMKDVLAQIMAPMLLVTLLMEALQIFQIKGFLKRNRRNIEIGESIEYSKSKFYYYRFAYFTTFICLILFIFYILYGAIALNNKIFLIALIPGLIGVIVGFGYRFFIKPTKISLGKKKIGLVITIIASMIISMFIFTGAMENFGYEDNSGDKPMIDGYKVMSINDFIDNAVADDGRFTKQSSVLVPQSYEYYSYNRDIGDSVKTEYAKALNLSIAKNLVNRYIKNEEKKLVKYSDMEVYFNEDIYNEYLFESAGITLEQFNSLRDGDIKMAIKNAKNKLKENSIIKDQNFWNLDEVYFLNYEKTKIVIRQGKEVFLLEGKDFTDPQIIKIIKEKLEL